MHKNYTEITVIGKDKKGVIAAFTSFLFENKINIEDLDQTVLKGMFSMKLHGDTTLMKISKDEFLDGINLIAKKLKMAVKVRFPSDNFFKTHGNACNKRTPLFNHSGGCKKKRE